MSEKLSVILPVYNEAEGVKKSLEQLTTNLASACSDFEIIVVDDGSVDNTYAVVEGVAEVEPRVRLIRQWSNRGFGAAVLLGFANARHGLLLITPADNIVYVEELERMFKLIEDNDIVAGARQGRIDYGRLRKFCSSALRFMVKVLFGLKMDDIGWVAMYRKDKLVSLGVRTQFEFSLGEILIRAKTKGCKIAEMPVHYSPRTSGKHTGATVKAILSTLRDLIKIRLDLWF